MEENNLARIPTEDHPESMLEELIRTTIAQQMAKLETYTILKGRGLPIPSELKDEIENYGER